MNQKYGVTPLWAESASLPMSILCTVWGAWVLVTSVWNVADVWHTPVTPWQENGFVDKGQSRPVMSRNAAASSWIGRKWLLSHEESCSLPATLLRLPLDSLWWLLGPSFPLFPSPTYCFRPGPRICWLSVDRPFCLLCTPSPPLLGRRDNQVAG